MLNTNEKIKTWMAKYIVTETKHHFIRHKKDSVSTLVRIFCISVTSRLFFILVFLCNIYIMSYFRYSRHARRRRELFSFAHNDDRYDIPTVYYLRALLTTTTVFASFITRV